MLEPESLKEQNFPNQLHTHTKTTLWKVQAQQYLYSTNLAEKQIKSIKKALIMVMNSFQLRYSSLKLKNHF
jgi:hypothetical protein